MYWGFQHLANSSELEFWRGWGLSNFIARFFFPLKREEYVSREQTQRQGGNRREWIENTNWMVPTVTSGLWSCSKISRKPAAFLV